MKTYYILTLSKLYQTAILNSIIQLILFLLISAILFIIIIILLRLKDLNQQKKIKLFKEKWESSFFDYIGSEKDPNEFADKIPKSSATILLIFLKEYFNLLNGKELVTLQKLINDTWIFSFLLKDLGSKSSKKIIRALYFFGISKNQKVKPKIAEFLSSRNQIIFLHAAQSLAKINALEYTERILASANLYKQISDDMIVSVLLEFNSEVCDYLTKRIIIEDEKFKVGIIKILTYFKFRQAANKVIKLLETVENKPLIIECIKYVKQIECIESLAILKNFFNHTDPEIRSEAIKAVAQIGDDNETLLLSTNLYDKSIQVQIDTAEALVKFKRKGVMLLQMVAASNSDPSAASVAQMVLNEYQLEKSNDV